MLFILLCLGIIATVLLLIMSRFNKRLKLTLSTIKYEIIYNILGARALGEDLLLKHQNKTDLPSLRGRVAIVTGGSRGIGVQIVKMLAECEINVIIACRNVEAGETVAREIRDSNSNVPEIRTFELDIGSLNSVSKFAQRIRAEYPKIHYLVNNAGIMFGPYKESVDGYESQFAVNYLGHFLLTHLLLPNLKNASDDLNLNARIVNVSSCAHFPGNINFNNINMREEYIPAAAYAQSKLAQVLFSVHLNNVLKAEGASVQVHAVHPGVVNTELFDGTPLKRIAPWAPKLFFKSPSQGAASVVYACVSQELEDNAGNYISNCKISRRSAQTYDKNLQAKMFEFTNGLLKIKQFGHF